MRSDPPGTVRLSAAQADELRSTTAAVRARGLRAAAFGREDFALPGLAPMLEGVLRELEDGRGYVLLRGLPFEDEEDAARVLWGIGTHLGRALRQHARVNLGGFRDDLVAHIVDQGLDYNAPNVHGSATGAEQMPHTDPADVVALLCVRPAASGGLSRIASATAVYDELRTHRPDLLAVLEKGYLHDLRGSGTAQGAQLTPHRIPVFSLHGGKRACIFNSRTVLAGAAKSGVPLSALEREALDAVLEIAQRPGLQIEMNLQPGDLQLLNNYTMLHSRTGWTDADPARRRLMLRLWLKVANARALAPGISGGYVSGAHYDVAEQVVA